MRAKTRMRKKSIKLPVREYGSSSDLKQRIRRLVEESAEHGWRLIRIDSEGGHLELKFECLMRLKSTLRGCRCCP